MRKPTDNQSRALRGVATDTDVVAYLEQCLADTKDKLVTQQDNSVLRVLQGEAQFCRKLLTHITGDDTYSGKR